MLLVGNVGVKSVILFQKTREIGVMFAHLLAHFKELGLSQLGFHRFSKRLPAEYAIARRIHCRNMIGNIADKKRRSLFLILKSIGYDFDNLIPIAALSYHQVADIALECGLI